MFGWFKRTPEKTPARAPLVRRNYAAATIGRLTNDWTTTATTPDQLVYQNLRILRARSRDSLANNDFTKRFTGMLKTNVVGPTGFAFQSMAYGRGGKTDADKLARDIIEQAFKLWGRKETADLCRSLSFLGMQHLVISTLAIDGEIFVRKHNGGKPFNRQLELIDPALIDVGYFDTCTNGNAIRFGIEYDNKNRPVAYHIGEQAEGVMGGYHAQQRTRVPASDIIHLFLVERVGQRRGIPWTATSLYRMHMLKGYEEAALVNARASAAKMGFIVSPDGDPMEGQQENGMTISQFEAGTMETLAPGYDFKPFDPGYPEGEFRNFSSQCLRGIAAGLGVSYNSLANDLSDVNFSSMRHGALEEREMWKLLQEWIAESLLTPVFEWWLDGQLEPGAETLMFNGRPLNRAPHHYLPHHFQGRRWDWVDPVKDITARKMEYELNVTSLSQIIRERGRNPADVFAEIANEKKQLKELGIGPSDVINALEADDAEDSTDS